MSTATWDVWGYLEYDVLEDWEGIVLLEQELRPGEITGIPSDMARLLY